MLPICEAGRVFLPARAVWKDAFVRELLDFPAARTNDQVDAFVWALSYVLLVKKRRAADEHWNHQLAKLQDWIAR